MIAPLLEVRQAHALPLPACPWLIDGGDPRKWLGEICGWGVPLLDLKVFLLPRSIRDPRAGGALVVVPAGVQPRVSPLALPYRCLGGKVFIPCEGELHPPLSDPELGQLMVHDVQVLRPGRDPAGFSTADALRITDLVAPPAIRDADWGRAVPGIALARRLLVVEPEEVPSVAEVMQEGKDEIGASAGEELPPVKGGTWLKKLLDRPLQTLYRLVRRKKDPSARSGSGLAGRALEALRNLELRRLERLLDDDPDEGLRYALPLHGSGQRGRDKPGARLMPRRVDFNLRRLLGGGRGDPWEISLDATVRLTSKYRMAADREVRLGRYRRAAYILAELLGDLNGAAAVLAQGRFFREAAALYRDRLHNPAGAARCLEEGGLLLEAAEIYEKELGRHEKAGDIHSRIERAEDARRCYLLALDAEMKRQGFLEAARIQEKKLHDPEGALELLSSRWALMGGGAQGLEAIFGILRRLGRHPEALQRVEALRRAIPDGVSPEGVARVLSGIAASYPGIEVRPAAADAVRVIAGRAMRAFGVVRQLVEPVSALDPGDLLLARDGARFLAGAGTRKGRAPEEPLGGYKIRSWRLPAGRPLAAIALDSGFLAILEDRGKTRLVRGGESSSFQEADWRDGVPRSLLVAGIPGQAFIVLDPQQGVRVPGPPMTFPATSDFRDPLLVSELDWIKGATVLGLTIDDRGIAWLATACETGVALDARDPSSGGLAGIASTRTLELRMVSTLPLPVAAARGEVMVGLGSEIFHLRPGSPRWVHLPSSVRRIAMAPAGSPVAAAAALEWGAGVIRKNGSVELVAGDLHFPKLAFTPEGLLAVAGAERGYLYHAEEEKVIERATLPRPGEEVLEVLPTGRPGEFTVITVTGSLSVFQF